MALERFDSRISDWHFLQRAEGRGRKIFWGADQIQKFIIIINMLYFYKYPPDIDGAVTLCVYSSLFLCVCVLANFLHCNKSPTKAPFSAISNEAIYTQQFVPQSFSSVTTDILFDWLNVVNQLKETWGQFGIIKSKSTLKMAKFATN